MWKRGEVFWQWADPALHHRTHDETLENGVSIDVQVRLSTTGATQLFIGVYAEHGQRLLEEAFMKRPGETMTTAMLWGVSRGRKVAESSATSEPRHFSKANCEAQRLGTNEGSS